MVSLKKAVTISALALPVLVRADSSSQSAVSTVSCNPLETSSCSPDKALATSFAEDFTTESQWFEITSTADEVYYTDEGLKLTLAKRFDNPSLRSKFYLMYGKLEVLLKAANGTGIVSSFYLQSDDLDEIDLEWLGGDSTQVQSNFFSKGNTTTYDRGKYHSVSNPQESYHNYTIDWSMEELVWYIDGTPVRTLKNDTTDGYPQSPMYVMIGIWAGGDATNAAGTIEWAGGSTDYTKVPFSMYVERLIVTDYSSGSEYIYSDQSGDWTSIEAVDGEINGRLEKASQEFDILVAGGTVEDNSSSGSSSSSSSSSESSSDGSSSTDSSIPSSDSSSSSDYDGLSSSFSRVSSVYTSAASSLYSRSLSSSKRATITSGSTTILSGSTTNSTSSSTHTSEANDDGGLDDETTPTSTSSSTATTNTVKESSNGISLYYHSPMGNSALRAIMATITISFGIMLLM